ncbi:MAG: ribonuclease H-like domain-containing protein [Candidatus Eisenbacteria bacterium]
MTGGAGDTLRARLGELVRTRRAVPAASAVPGAAGAAGAAAEPKRRRRKADGERSTQRAGVEEFLPGGEWADDRGGKVYVHERLRSQVERRRPHWGRLPMPDPAGEPTRHDHDLAAIAAGGLERVLFLDLETCGLASNPIFLAGTMHWNGEDFVLRQYFARHYGEEAALLRAVHAHARQHALLVTFNGKTFDAPMLRTRALALGVELELPPAHFDLLHASRRRWKHELPDCRLQTLERRVCGRPLRTGDVDGSEVPGLYHDYVKSGDPWPLAPVFHHNLVDVIVMGDLLHALCAGVSPRPRRAFTFGD